MKSVGKFRVGLDKFYTSEDVANDCIDYWKQCLNPGMEDIIIEPSAGDGVFSIPLQSIFTNVEAYDIDPSHDTILKADFLKMDIQNSGKPIHVIGNPPFGRQSSLAKKFIKKCCTFANTISFILPKSFKKDSFRSVFEIHYHLLTQREIPKNSFRIYNEIYDVPCIFQIWEKKTSVRENFSITETPYFYSYVKKNQNPDLAIRRVGVYAGKMFIEDIENKNHQSHYFIKLEEGLCPKKILELYSSIISFEEENTVGPKSISKPELNAQMLKLIQ